MSVNLSPSLAELVEKFTPPNNIEQFQKTLSCPITHYVFFDPVFAQDGFTYERDAITLWFKTKETSPMTQSTIGTTLIPNQLAKTFVAEYLAQFPKDKELQFKREISEDELRIMISIKTDDELVTLFAENPTYLAHGNALIVPAVAKRKYKLAKHFIENNISTNARDKETLTILHHCCNCDMHELTPYLIAKCVENGMSIDVVNDKCNTPLWILFENKTIQGALDILHIMLKHGANINHMTPIESNYIHACCIRNNVSMLEYLIQHGLDIHCKNQRNQTPIGTCVRQDSFECAEILCKNGANFDMVDNVLIVDWCINGVMRESKINLVKKHHKCFASVVNHNGSGKKTMLNYHAYQGNYGIVQILLDSGADTTITCDGDYPLERLLTNIGAPEELIKCFINKGAPITKRTLSKLCDHRNGIHVIMSYMPNVKK